MDKSLRFETSSISPQQALPVEPGQAAMHYLWQLDPNASGYVVYFIVRLDQPQSGDVTALIRAFERVRALHPALCSRFVSAENGLVQYIERERPLELREYRMTREEVLPATMSTALEKPLDLARGVCRLELFRVGDSDPPIALFARFLVHHIVVDGIAIDQILHDLEHRTDPSSFSRALTLYEAVIRRRSTYEKTPAYALDQAFWSEQVARIADLELPLDHPRPPRQTFNGSAVPFELDATASDRLMELASQPGQSLLAILIAAHATALHGLTGGQTDFAIGTTFHNRTRAEAALVANLSNTLPTLAEVTPETSFNDYAQATRRRLMRIARHRQLFTAHLPRPQVRTDRSPLFQTHVLLHNAEVVRRIQGETEIAFQGVSGCARFVEQRPQEGQFELSIEAVYTGERLAFTVKYNVDLLRRDTAEHFAAALADILVDIASNPERKVQTLAARAARPAPPSRDHIGYAVPDLGAALEGLRAVHRIAKIEGPLHDPLQGADLCMVTTAAGDRIELVAGEAVQGLLARGAGPYHSCYRVEDLEAEIAARRNAGQTLISTPRPAPLFHQQRVAFLSTALGIEELLERPSTPSRRLVVAADFTAAPLQERLETWARALGWRRLVEIAPTTQIAEALLSRDPALATDSGEVNLILTAADPDWSAAARRDYLDGLSRASESFAAQSQAHTILALCPMPGVQDAAWLNAVAASPYLVRLDLARLLPTPESLEHFVDAESFRLGRVPYRLHGFDHLALALARAIHALDKRPHKLIVVDGDDTLWAGVAAEDGAEGISVTESHRALQTFLLQQKAQGVLLALASKNDPDDVKAVFDHHPEMLLSLDDFVATKINWAPKPENVRALAQALDLGLNSFIFVDNNPIECVQMRTHCSEVMVIELSSELDIPAYLHRVWTFDHIQTGTQTIDRTALYRAEAQREAARAETQQSLVDYIDALELELSLFPPDETHLARAVELTRRTNQFNLNGYPATASELRDDPSAGRHVRLVSVRDRFGDDGIVGLVVLELGEQGLASLRHFLLSCRVLGRGIEYRVLRDTANIAATAGAQWLAFDAVDTGRNTPLQDFLNKIGVPLFQGATLSTEAARALDWRQALTQPVPAINRRTDTRAADTVSGPAKRSPVSLAGSPVAATVAPEVLDWIARALDNDAALSRFYRPYACKEPSSAEIDDTNDTTLYSQVFGLAAQTLGTEVVDASLSFAELGGDSLAAVSFLAAVNHAFGTDINLLELLDADSLQVFADRLARRDRRSAQVLREPSAAAASQLVLVYPSGGDCSCYGPLVEVLAADCRAIAVNPSSETTAKSLVELAQEGLACAQKLLDPNLPTVFAGWSLGATLAHSMAQQWRATAHANIRLFMIDPIRPPTAPSEPEVRALVDNMLERIALGAAPSASARLALETRVARELTLLAAHRPVSLSVEASIFLASQCFAGSDWDTETLWREALPNAVIHRLDGDHVDLLRHTQTREALCAFVST
ncbi:MAG: HAD-IIIC family phosphatase [Halochromatium sp.]|uniref:HAD-IIIC family phosphatase n=1 Tax=Halochromatium sp. TaxID=2049430 RepID=UPI00397D6A4D